MVASADEAKLAAWFISTDHDWTTKSAGWCSVFAAFVASRARAEQPILTDDGLHKQPWFLESFLDLGDDLEGAGKEGKRFVVMWELKRLSPIARKRISSTSAQPRIADYVKTNFEVLQLNIIGSRKVTDFDGTELSEKRAGRKIRRAFHADLSVLWRKRAQCSKTCRRLNVKWPRSPGYMLLEDFLAMFRYVREKAYESKSFRDYLKAMPS